MSMEFIDQDGQLSFPTNYSRILENAAYNTVCGTIRARDKVCDVGLFSSHRNNCFKSGWCSSQYTNITIDVLQILLIIDTTFLNDVML